MKFSIVVFSILAIVAASVVTSEAQGTVKKSGFVYPKVRRVNKTWSFKSAKAKGNVTYADPYYWLEGDGENKEIQQFVSDQTNLTEKYMQGCKNKDEIVNSLLEASTFENYVYAQYVTPTNGKSFYLYAITTTGDEPPLLYTASVSEFQAAKKTNFATPPGNLFLNVSLLSSDASASLNTIVVSPNGKIFGYQLTEGGVNNTWYFRSFQSPLTKAKTFPNGGEGRLKDFLPFSSIDNIFWSPDSKGIFYSTVADSNGGTNTKLSYKVRHHVWGTDNTQDITLFDSKNAGEYGENCYFYMKVSP